MTFIVTTWTRNTQWRQGHVLTQECVKELGLVNPDAADCTCVVVISHDCDLANDDLQTEPNVEVIIGCLPKEGSGNYFWAKAPRTLHLDALHGAVPTVIELIATAKRLVPKSALAAFTADTTYSLSGNSVSILRSWLAVRYNRAAFSDLFVQRLSKQNVDKKLAKLIEPRGQLLSAIYFNVDGGEEKTHADDDPVDLKIILTYPSGEDPEQTAAEVEKLEATIEKLFSDKYYDLNTNTWNGIAMKTCMSISEDDFPVSKTRLLTEWRLEHMTLKAED